MFGNYKSKNQLIVSVAAYTGSSIFGPMILFGIGGYFLDKQMDTKPLYLLVGIGVAFVISNILIIKKARSITKSMVEDAKIEKKDKVEETL